MKLKLLIGLFILSIAFSCKGKEEDTKQENSTEANASVTSIQLANYSDENWKNGVGITFNMLLVDYSKEKYELIKNYMENIKIQIGGGYVRDELTKLLPETLGAMKDG